MLPRSYTARCFVAAMYLACIIGDMDDEEEQDDCPVCGYAIGHAAGCSDDAENWDDPLDDDPDDDGDGF